MKKQFLWVMLLIGMFLGLVANCYALSYSEPSDLGGLNIGSLDLGSNTVSGSMFFNSNANPSVNDQDGFDFNIDSGSILNSISFAYQTTYQDLVSVGTLGAGMGWILEDLSDSTSYVVDLFGPTGNIFGSGTHLLFSGLNFGEGSYSLDASPISIAGGDIWTTNYTLTLQVDPSAPVPEPATVLLLGTGLLGLAELGRKKILKK